MSFANVVGQASACGGLQSAKIVLLVGLLGISIACTGRKHEAVKTVSAAPPVAVSTLEVRAARWPDSFEATGTVHARQSAIVAARVQGYIREIRVQAGDAVRAGQLLVQIEARELDLAHQQAQAAVAEAKSAVPEVAGAIRSAEAQVDLARLTHGRMKDLLEKRSVSQQEFDEAAARLRVAEAGRDAALAKKQQLEDKIRQAEQGAASASVMMGYASLTAPFAGRVVARKADPGTLASPGQPILEIEQEGSWRLEANVEETRVGRLARGQTAEVRLDAAPDEVLTGRVVEIVPAVDAASRSFIAKIDLPARSVLRSGLFGRARFSAGERDALAVPAAAVQRQGQVESVLVADQGVARRRLVRIGDERAGQIEILSGLAAGDRILYPVPTGLADGARIQ